MKGRNHYPAPSPRQGAAPAAQRVTTCEEDEALLQSTGKSWHQNKEASPGKRRRSVKTHLVDDDAWLEKEASIPARRDGGWQLSWWGLPPLERSPWSPRLAITGDKTRQASRVVAGKGNFFHPNSTKIKRARRAVWHHIVYTIEENQSDSSEPMPGTMNDVPGASARSTSKPWNAPLTANGDRARMTTSFLPAWRGSKEAGPSCTQL
jgi:hypothetical protein